MWKCPSFFPFAKRVIGAHDPEPGKKRRLTKNVGDFVLLKEGRPMV